MSYRNLFPIIICLLGMIASSAVQAQNWQFTNGPSRPHEVLDIVVGKNANGQKIYATDSDELKLSTNGGITWLSSQTTMVQPIVVTCKSSEPDIAVIAKFHPGGVGTQGIHYTADGGNTWLNATPYAQYDFQPQRIVISSGNSDLVFLGTERDNPTGNPRQTSLWKSSNGGASWYPIDYFKTSAYTYVNDVLPHPNTSPTYKNYIWVGGSQEDVIEPPVMDPEGSPPSVNKKGVWRSSDGGVTWTPQMSGFPSSTDLNVTALAISEEGSSQLLFAATKATSQAKIYQSTDLGVTWTVSSSGNSDIHQIRSMKVNPYNSDMIVAGTDNGIYMSTNRGGSWDRYIPGLPQPAINIHSVAFDLNDQSGNTVYIGTGTSVYKGTFTSGSPGSWSWTAVSTGTSLLKTTNVAVYSGTVYAVSSSWDGMAKYSSGSWQVPVTIKGALCQSSSIKHSNPSCLTVTMMIWRAAKYLHRAIK